MSPATERTETLAARLARLGFTEPARALATLAEPAVAQVARPEVIEGLGTGADPDLALRTLSRVLGAAADEPRARGFASALLEREDVRAGAAAVLGVSEALGDHLVRHPEDWVYLGSDVPRLTPEGTRQSLLAAVGADGDAKGAAPVATLPTQEATLELRRAYRRALLQIARADLVGEQSYDWVVAGLSDAADSALEGALAIARAEVGAAAADVRLAVIAMGKCGARELNYISDVDVIFVAEPAGDGDDQTAVQVGSALAAAMMRICSSSTIEGSLWEVDPGLRPEGRSGALVRTLESHIGYYERWAKTWEFQALLKARQAAGDGDLGRRYADATAEFVWSAAGRENFVDDVQAMRRRVEQSVPTRTAARQLKLGPGGLRDVEFSVQLLQLVHGRSDAMVRSPNTLHALEALANYGYVGRKDAAGLGQAYRFLRTLEHRLQLYRLRRVHVVPDSPVDLRRTARSLGFTRNPIEEFDAAWRTTAREARRLHEKLFYRPLLRAVARLEPGEARLSPEAAGQRLKALGFADPRSALSHLQALTSGVTRRAAIQRTLLPVLLGWFADSPDPDAALLGFRQVSEALGATPWYLRLLRDESVAAERLADILGSSRYTSDLLLRAPEAVSMLGSGAQLGPRPIASLESEALAAVTRHDDPVAAIKAVRAFRRRELFRISVADILHVGDVSETVRGLSEVTTATITAALQIAVNSVARDTGKLHVRFLVVGMGRFGGGEMTYSSDADVVFAFAALHDDEEELAARQALAVANELRRLLSLPSPDPPLELDADLRPEGRNGPLVRSVASYRAYYERWSSPWEAQALLRARPVSGDPGLGAAFTAIIDPLRYPEGGLNAASLLEMRRLKARMESERLPRGADPILHTKLGPGGLSDVEWTVQLLQMRHGHDVPELRTPQTLPALDAAVTAGLIAGDDAEALRAAWVAATGIRNATMLATGRASDMLPSDTRTLATVAHLLRVGDGDPQRLLEEYRRSARRARRVVDRVFYGVSDSA